MFFNFSFMILGKLSMLPPPAGKKKNYASVFADSIPFRINCFVSLLRANSWWHCIILIHWVSLHAWLKCITLCLFKYLISSGSSLCVCCTTCGEMLFSQLGNAKAFADALCSGQLLCSAFLVIPLFLREHKAGRRLLGHHIKPVDNHGG